MVHALVFDSGVGGLSVVEELRALMPDLHMSYVADDEFRPYGEKTEAALQSRLPGLLNTLCIMLEPDVVVLACNTASTTALAQIRAELDIPVVGVVPAIKPAAQNSVTKAIAVLGTPGTVRRRYVDRLISEFAADCQVSLHGSTQLVELAERKLSGQAIDAVLLKNELMPLFKQEGTRKIDTIVLACTHFPLLLDELTNAAPRKIKWVDSGAAIARRTQSVLKDVKTSPPTLQSQTAFLIGGSTDPVRTSVFKDYGFSKTVTLSGYHKMP
jgi:glutamate racemase